MLINVLTLLYVIYAIVAAVVVINFSTQNKVDIDDAELKIFINRMAIESSSFDKELQRQQPGILDTLETDSLDKRIDFGKEKSVSGKLTIGTIALYLNQQRFSLLRPRVGYDIEAARQIAVILVNGDLKKMEIEAVT